MSEEMKMDGAISEFFRERYSRDWKPKEQVEFLIELFSNLSLHVRPVFPSDEKMVLVTSQMMEEALKRRKVKVIFGEVEETED
ncbi:hypothetical protein G9G63_09655 [Paenibacillus sp. EKM202P]|uniref:hypothetical protein n=1 Tax=unclassified Paenibacillus TaxID=185978 RepID=UPI0013ED51DB|nr:MULTISPECIES: hypothetical protein [unclassified Paenibacillus]KAF6565412.1 hypothetical protein G9G63_09655 [Paenibacillus sp. EKM202P]KAF6569263.1 hypothetical protein G9G64_12440 [Paenibacillus sp. EKM207P]